MNESPPIYSEIENKNLTTVNVTVTDTNNSTNGVPLLRPCKYVTTYDKIGQIKINRDGSVNFIRSMTYEPETNVGIVMDIAIGGIKKLALNRDEHKRQWKMSKGWKPLRECAKRWCEINQVDYNMSHPSEILNNKGNGEYVFEIDLFIGSNRIVQNSSCCVIL